MKRRLGIVITDGVGFRNFIINDFIFEALKTFDEVVIFSFLPSHVYPQFSESVTIVPMEFIPERTSTWFFRKFKEVAHMQKFAARNFGINDNLKATTTFVCNVHGVLNAIIHFISRFLHSESVIQIAERLQFLSYYSQPALKRSCDLLENHKVDVLFFTHQRPPFIAPVIKCAKDLKIKTATFIFSWDNLASKGRMAGSFDRYLVWSNLMKSDLLEFYASVSETHVHVVGTPQFVPFVTDSFGQERADFFKKFDLNPNLPLVVFTCNDSSSRNDPHYLDVLAQFIENKQLTQEVSVLVRTSPAEDPLRFAAIRERYPFLKWNDPKWPIASNSGTEMWAQRTPTHEDISDLKSMLQYAEFTINVLSTITIDSFIFDKPVINPVFGTGSNGLWNDQKFLKFRHLELLERANASLIVKDADQYLTAINFLLSGGDDKAAARKSFVDLQINIPLSAVNKTIVKTLCEFE